MKALFVGTLLAVMVAMPVYGAEAAKQPEPAPVAAAAPAASGPKIKEVCKDVKGKDGKVTKQCKKIKVHKKLEGTKVPEAKK